MDDIEIIYWLIIAILVTLFYLSAKTTKQIIRSLITENKELLTMLLAARSVITELREHIKVVDKSK